MVAVCTEISRISNYFYLNRSHEKVLDYTGWPVENSPTILTSSWLVSEEWNNALLLAISSLLSAQH
jgi:hypothetical protein